MHANRLVLGEQVTRRSVLGAVAAGMALATTDPARAQPAAAPAPRVQGPRVWLDMDQKDLDDAYDQSVYAPNLRQIIGRYTTNSEAARARLGAPRRHAYGPTAV
jgi:arylformamidase